MLRWRACRLITGIYASLLPALGGCAVQLLHPPWRGPHGATSLLIGASLTGLAEPGSAQWVQMAVWIALLSGALQCVMGLARFGWVVNIVTSPVLNGFTQSSSIVDPWLLSWGPHGASVELGALLATPSLGLFDLAALAFGVGSVGALLLAKS